MTTPLDAKSMIREQPRIIDSRHPNFLATEADWEKWRLAHRGGEPFKDKYLKQFTQREDATEFNLRFDMSPVPKFSAAAINDIRNSIFQRMGDIVRTGGSESYRKAVAGLDQGVDRRGSSMNSFLGIKVLEELLVMGQVGVYVDNPVVHGAGTLADTRGSRPYLYRYQREDILNWTCSRPEAPSEYQSILLRDHCMTFDPRTRLPLVTFERFRLLWIDETTGRVNLQFLSTKGDEVDRDGRPSGPVELELTRIPFAMFDIGESLMKDVADYQIALLNLASSDIWYALKANFPFYTEQKDMRAVGAHLKPVASDDGTSTAGGQGAADTNIKVGTTQGRAYDKNTERPAFIHPSPEPLRASMELQEKLENDIRKIVNLAVTNLKRQSAESKAMDNQGLEAGLSFIGEVLSGGERLLAEYWAAYENREPSRRLVPTISYPERYKLKTDAERLDEAEKLSGIGSKVPSRTAKKELAKATVASLFSGRVPLAVIDTINKEIDDAPYTTSDPKTIIEAKEQGLVGDKTGSIALGFQDDEYLQAREDHAARAVRIAKAQASSNSDPAARGVDDLSDDPANAGRDEKTASRDTTLRDNTETPVRGEGK